MRSSNTMASMAARSTIIVRTLCRASAKSTAGRASFPLRASNSASGQNPNATPRLSLLRRELSSFKPLHTAIASAHLVSRLPTEATTSSQGRFANYVSPI